jgi:hypothetical protein
MLPTGIPSPAPHAAVVESWIRHESKHERKAGGAAPRDACYSHSSNAGVTHDDRHACACVQAVAAWLPVSVARDADTDGVDRKERTDSRRAAAHMGR